MYRSHALVYAWAAAAVFLLSLQAPLQVRLDSHPGYSPAKRLSGYEELRLSDARPDVPELSRAHPSTYLLSPESRATRKRRRRSKLVHLLVLILTVLILVLLLAILSKAITLCMMDSILARYEAERQGRERAAEPRPEEGEEPRGDAPSKEEEPRKK